jgi:hypothetical protein
VVPIYAKWLADAGNKALIHTIINEDSSLLRYLEVSTGKWILMF